MDKVSPEGRSLSFKKDGSKNNDEEIQKKTAIKPINSSTESHTYQTQTFNSHTPLNSRPNIDKNGLKDILIFNDLKPDNPTWSFPGKKSNITDWKKYFQSYKKEYNADVILIDGRFKVATAMDIFDKIRDDTIILLHEYFVRPSYFILEK